MSDSLNLAWVPMRSRTTMANRTTAFAASSATLIALGIAVLTMAAYAVTMAPDLYSLDSPELAAAAHNLGIAHAPGYPLYTLTGWVFSHAFPIGSVAFRLNLLSALFGTAAVTLTYVMALRLTARPLVAAAGALAFAFSYYVWITALAAEVYTLDAALFAGMLLAAYQWRTQRTAAAAALTGLLVGLSLATRTTSALFLPALLGFAWVSGERAPRTYAAAAGAMLAGLAFYAYLPLRSLAGVDTGPGTYGLDGSLKVVDLATLGGFWDHVTAAQFRQDAFAYGPLGVVRETGKFIGWLSGSFLLVGVPFGIAGIVRLWKRDRALLLLIGGTALPAAAFFINYGTLDKEFMFAPVYLSWALLMVAGIDWTIEAAVASEPSWDRSMIVNGAALVLPLAALAVNLPLVNLHGERAVRNDSEVFLAQVQENAIVYGPFLDVAPYQYLQQVEDLRTDVALVNSWTVDDTFLLELAAANVGTRPLYITQEEPVLRRLYRMVPVGDGFQVLPRGGG